MIIFAVDINKIINKFEWKNYKFLNIIKNNNKDIILLPKVSQNVCICKKKWLSSETNRSWVNVELFTIISNHNQRPEQYLKNTFGTTVYWLFEWFKLKLIPDISVHSHRMHLNFSKNLFWFSYSVKSQTSTSSHI